MGGLVHKITALALAVPLIWAASAASASTQAALDAARLEVAAAGLTGRILVADGERVMAQTGIGPTGEAPLWPWSSVSKQVTASLVMIEVDKGRLSLDDTVGARLPGFANTATAGVTLRQLLMHTSGLPNPDDTPQQDGAPSFYLRPGGEVGGRADALGYCAGPPKRPAGEAFAYNNCDTIVLGAVLEAVSGQRFADLLATRIARPLKLKTLKMSPPGQRLVTARSADGPLAAWNLATFGAGGAMIGSPEDLVRFDQALLRGGLVSAASTQVMWAGEPRLGYVALGAWSFTAPLAGCKDPVALIERRGSVDGIQTRNLIAPDLKRILVVFTDNADFDFGEVWQGRGPTYSLASAAFCS